MDTLNGIVSNMETWNTERRVRKLLPQSEDYPLSSDHSPVTANIQFDGDI